MYRHSTLENDTHEAWVYILLTHKKGVSTIFRQLFHSWAMQSGAN
jgi:hypothetical protein